MNNDLPRLTIVRVPPFSYFRVLRGAPQNRYSCGTLNHSSISVCYTWTKSQSIFSLHLATRGIANLMWTSTFQGHPVRPPALHFIRCPSITHTHPACLPPLAYSHIPFNVYVTAVLQYVQSQHSRHSMTLIYIRSASQLTSQPTIGPVYVRARARTGKRKLCLKSRQFRSISVPSAPLHPTLAHRLLYTYNGVMCNRDQTGQASLYLCLRHSRTLNRIYIIYKPKINITYVTHNMPSI